jgi:hypothetical protein
MRLLVGGFAPIWHTTLLKAAMDDGRTDGLIHSAGRGAGTGMTAKELKRLAQVLTPLPGADDATGEPPPRDSRFGLRLKLSGVHWVRPEVVVVVDVTYFTWTEDNLPVAGLASQGAADGQAGNAGSADNSASASTQRGPSMNESETGIGRCQRRWFGIIFLLPVVPTATQAARENDDVGGRFRLGPLPVSCVHVYVIPALIVWDRRHPRCGMIWAFTLLLGWTALVGCWH